MSLAQGEPLKLAVVGAGLIGRRHIDLVRVEPEARLSAIVDPAPSSQRFTDALGVQWYAGLQELLKRARPDGMIVTTPNQLHIEHGLLCVDAGIPALIEKPLADEVENGCRLVEAAASAGATSYGPSSTS